MEGQNNEKSPSQDEIDALLKGTADSGNLYSKIEKRKFKDVPPEPCPKCGNPHTQKETIFSPGEGLVSYCPQCQETFNTSYDFHIEMDEDDHWFFPYLNKGLTPRISQKELEKHYNITIEAEEWKVLSVTLSICQRCCQTGMKMTLRNPKKDHGLKIVTIKCPHCDDGEHNILLDNDLLT